MSSSSAKARTTKSQKTRGLGFSTKELDCLLDCFDEHLPIGLDDEWDRVHRDHLLHLPNMARTKESLKKKFMTMYQKRMPTGDPNCPSEIRWAKQFYEEIKKKTDLSDCEDGRSEEEEEEVTNNDDDDDEDNVDPDHDHVEDADDAPPPAKRSKKATGDGVAFLTRREEQQGRGIKPLDRIVRSQYKKKSSANDEEDFSLKN